MVQLRCAGLKIICAAWGGCETKKEADMKGTAGEWRRGEKLEPKGIGGMRRGSLGGDAALEKSLKEDCRGSRSS